jgi:hypothetical protein
MGLAVVVRGSSLRRRHVVLTTFVLLQPSLQWQFSCMTFCRQLCKAVTLLHLTYARLASPPPLLLLLLLL